MTIKITRRGFTAAAALALAPRFGFGASGDPVATTGSGPVRGRLVDGVSVFKGIPYGAPTGGANRFRRPRDPEPWREPRDAFEYGPAAPQPPSALIQDRATSEDCLVLNVWTPGLDDARRPVMVWLHGGGFSTLSGSSPAYDGGALCRRGDVVVVTLNHRLNVLGFLYLQELAGPDWSGAGNAGMLDIVHALKWVRANIARFGGDPKNVMIFGESGGGRKVSTLMGMPVASGLFHRAAIQSGPGLHLQPRDKATAVAVALFDALDVKPGDAKKLQELPVEELIAAQSQVAAGFDSGARMKGRFEQRGFVPTVGVPEFPAYAFDPIASPVSVDVPLLIGTNRHELALRTRGDPEIYEKTLSPAGLEARVKVMAGNAADRVLDIYARLYPKASPAERWVLMLTDRTYRFDSITLAERKAAQGAGVWMYYFTFESRTDPKLLAHHALEIPFVFDNLTSSGWTAADADSRALATKMSSAWIAFARNGTPATPALPEWPRYHSASRATMVFNTDCTVAMDPDAAVRELWATV